ncbi:LacI family DNA-binding transcriptional regulator [Paenibacillus cisolokensis]|uniref:LacI family DNA-binding transcriptional regulator n=1 Tax=Paenibacillus cisolokensis TaxID=1658519 RepID=UPI001BCF36A2|nr:LacI family DNA-binding transcriptional regulator [Paenibacillus cisolokensis]
MARKVSMQEIADRLGVSKYTVSQALSGKPGVSAATRRRVAALARALGYRKTGRDAPGLHEEGQEAARTAGPRLLVGMEEHHADEPMFWRRVMEGVAAGCREHGLRPEFSATAAAGPMRPPSRKPSSGKGTRPDTSSSANVRPPRCCGLATAGCRWCSSITRSRFLPRMRC